MAHLCTGVSRAAESGAFYYDDNTLNEINVPVGHCKGTYILMEEELYKYFGVESKEAHGAAPGWRCSLRRMHLNSTWNSQQQVQLPGTLMVGQTSRGRWWRTSRSSGCPS